MVDPSSPFMQEDTTLQRVAIMGYGAAHFDVVMPSAAARGAQSQQHFITEWLPARQPAEKAAAQPASAQPGTVSMEGAIMAFPTAVVSQQ